MAPPRDVAASYRDQPAQRRLVHINYSVAGVRRDTVIAKASMGSTTEVIYDVRVAQCFDEIRIDALLAERTFGFNVIV